MRNNYNISKIYQEMELYLIESMKRNLSRHLDEEIKKRFKWPQWQAEKLKELKRFQNENAQIIGSSKNLINSSVSRQLREQFKEGSKTSQKQFRAALKNGYKFDRKLNKSFFGINDRKINSLINSVNNDLEDANYAVLRMMNDTYRQVIHKAATFVGNGVMTEKQAIDMATKDFLDKGLNCIEYSNGARVNIANYAKMAVRTANQRAFLQGEGEFRKKINNPLIKISKHGTACKLCQVWENKVLIDDVYSGGSSKDGQYPLLSMAMKQGLYHPNCFHGNGTYYPELEDITFDDDGPTSETLSNYAADINYCNQQIQRFMRLENGSLDENNIKKYRLRKQQWKNKKLSFKNNKWLYILSENENYALNSYISSESYIINNALINNFPLDERLTKISNDLSDALIKIPDTSGTFNRSLYFYDNISKQRFIDSMYDEPIIFRGFTSMSKVVYDERDDIRLIIKTKHGKDISVLNVNEQEVLLNKNSQFRLLKTYKKNGKLFFELEEI